MKTILQNIVLSIQRLKYNNKTSKETFWLINLALKLKNNHEISKMS